MTLVILGYDLLEADVVISATTLSENQIVCDITLKNKGEIQIQLQAKIAPSKPNAFVFQNLKQAPLAFYLTYVNENLQQQLDDYMHSKHLPLIGKEQSLPFTF